MTPPVPKPAVRRQVRCGNDVVGQGVDLGTMQTDPLRVVVLLPATHEFRTGRSSARAVHEHGQTCVDLI